MTLLEFESWVSDNYERLVDIVKSVSNNHDQAVDVLHDMIQAICEGRDQLPPYSIEQLEPGFFSRRLRFDVLDMYDSNDRYDGAIDRLEGEADALGLDDAIGSKKNHQSEPTDADWLLAEAIRGRRQMVREAIEYIDREAPICSAAAEYRRSVRKSQPKDPDVPFPFLRFEGRLEGSARYRFQQLRDGRLFDERAVRSLAESMHRASQRRRHEGWPGMSHTEFGTEAVVR